MNDEISNLTKRELQVLQLISQGLTNKEISHSLNIKVVTVEFHLGNLYKKLDVTTRTEAVMIAGKMEILKTYGNP